MHKRSVNSLPSSSHTKFPHFNLQKVIEVLATSTLLVASTSTQVVTSHKEQKTDKIQRKTSKTSKN
jgi:hypothetical protein